LDDTIYVIDELEIREGMTDEFLAAFRERYLPEAKARGMELQHTWVTPPEGPPGATSTVLLVWGVEGVPGFWHMRRQSGSPGIAAWWDECGRYCVRRRRRFAVDPDARARFSAAGRVHA